MNKSTGYLEPDLFSDSTVAIVVSDIKHLYTHALTQIQDKTFY